MQVIRTLFSLFFLILPFASALSSSRRTSTSRRDFGIRVAGLFGYGTIFLDTPRAAWAGPTAQEEIDKTNIVKGYERLNYLLDNWVKGDEREK